MILLTDFFEKYRKISLNAPGQELMAGALIYIKCENNGVEMIRGKTKRISAN